jgi:hypothetical protein
VSEFFLLIPSVFPGKYRDNNILGLDYLVDFDSGIHRQTGNKRRTEHATTSVFIRLKNAHNDRSYESTPSRVDVFESGTVLPGRSDVSLAATTRCRL